MNPDIPPQTIPRKHRTSVTYGFKKCTGILQPLSEEDKEGLPVSRIRRFKTEGLQVVTEWVFASPYALIITETP